MLAQAVQGDDGLTVSWLIKAALVVFAVLVVVGIVVGLSMLFWRLLLWVFFGGVKRGLASAAALAAGVYFNVINPVELFWQVDKAWGENPLVALAGMFVLAGPLYVVYLVFSDGSVSFGGQPLSGPSGGGSGSPKTQVASSGDSGSGTWPAPTDPPSSFDPRYGPQQGTSTLADQPGSIYGDGPQQGFGTLADEPGGLYSDGPEY